MRQWDKQPADVGVRRVGWGLSERLVLHAWWPRGIHVTLQLLFLVIAPPSHAHADRAHDRMRYTDALVDQLRRTPECGTKPMPWWCRAAKWGTGTGDPLPIGKPLIGRWFIKGQPGLHSRLLRKIELRENLVA